MTKLPIKLNLDNIKENTLKRIQSAKSDQKVNELTRVGSNKNELSRVTSNRIISSAKLNIQNNIKSNQNSTNKNEQNASIPNDWPPFDKTKLYSNFELQMQKNKNQLDNAKTEQLKNLKNYSEFMQLTVEPLIMNESLIIKQFDGTLGKTFVTDSNDKSKQVRKSIMNLKSTNIDIQDSSFDQISYQKSQLNFRYKLNQNQDMFNLRSKRLDRRKSHDQCTKSNLVESNYLSKQSFYFQTEKEFDTNMTKLEMLQQLCKCVLDTNFLSMNLAKVQDELSVFGKLKFRKVNKFNKENSKFDPNKDLDELSRIKQQNIQGFYQSQENEGLIGQIQIRPETCTLGKMYLNFDIDQKHKVDIAKMSADTSNKDYIKFNCIFEDSKSKQFIQYSSRSSNLYQINNMLKFFNFFKKIKDCISVKEISLFQVYKTDCIELNLGLTKIQIHRQKQKKLSQENQIQDGEQIGYQNDSEIKLSIKTFSEQSMLNVEINTVLSLKLDKIPYTQRQNVFRPYQNEIPLQQTLCTISHLNLKLKSHLQKKNNVIAKNSATAVDAVLVKQHIQNKLLRHLHNDNYHAIHALRQQRKPTWVLKLKKLCQFYLLVKKNNLIQSQEVFFDALFNSDVNTTFKELQELQSFVWKTLKLIYNQILDADKKMLTFIKRNEPLNYGIILYKFMHNIEQETNHLFIKLAQGNRRTFEEEQKIELYKTTHKFVKNNLFDNLVIAHFKEMKNWVRSNVKTEENSKDSRKFDYDLNIAHAEKVSGVRTFIKHGGHRNFMALTQSTLKQQTKMKFKKVESNQKENFKSQKGLSHSSTTGKITIERVNSVAKSSFRNSVILEEPAHQESFVSKIQKYEMNLNRTRAKNCSTHLKSQYDRVKDKDNWKTDVQQYMSNHQLESNIVSNTNQKIRHDPSPDIELVINASKSVSTKGIVNRLMRPQTARDSNNNSRKTSEMIDSKKNSTPLITAAKSPNNILNKIEKTSPSPKEDPLKTKLKIGGRPHSARLQTSKNNLNGSIQSFNSSEISKKDQKLLNQLKKQNKDIKNLDLSKDDKWKTQDSKIDEDSDKKKKQKLQSNPNYYYENRLAQLDELSNSSQSKINTPNEKASSIRKNDVQSDYSKPMSNSKTLNDNDLKSIENDRQILQEDIDFNENNTRKLFSCVDKYNSLNVRSNYVSRPQTAKSTKSMNSSKSSKSLIKSKSKRTQEDKTQFIEHFNIGLNKKLMDELLN